MPQKKYNRVGGRPPPRGPISKGFWQPPPREDAATPEPAPAPKPPARRRRRSLRASPASPGNPGSPGNPHAVEAC